MMQTNRLGENVPDPNLNGRVALVTGGARGIGRSTAIALARAGAELVLLDRDLDAAQAAADEIQTLTQRGATSLQADVSSSEDVSRAVREALAARGRIDILVNNAGTWGHGPLAAVSEQEWDRIFATNLKGVMLCTRAVVLAMRRHGCGKIINIASAAGLAPSPDWSAYCISKAASIMLAEVAAKEFEEDNIQVNVLCPGAVDTDLTHHITRQTGAQFPHAIPPEQVADAVLSLVVPFEQKTTGEIIRSF